MAKKKKEELLELPSKDNILLEEKIDGNKIKEELEKYVDEKINKTFIDELDKTNRKLIREKSRKIIWKNIVILILLAIIGFLLYLLFSNNYFDKYFNKTNDDVVEKDESKKEEKKDEKKEEKAKPTPTAIPTPSPTPIPTPTPTPKVPTIDDLKKEYGNLIDNFYVTESSGYLVDYYSGNINDNLRKYITLNSFDFDKIKKEEDYQIISNGDFKDAFEKIFADEYSASTFEYNDNKIRFVSKMDSYMTSEILEKEDSRIKREITDIKVDGNLVIICTVDAYVKDNKVYEIINNTLVGDYEEDNLVKYQDKLNKMVYTFKNNKLVKLEKSAS